MRYVISLGLKIGVLALFMTMLTMFTLGDSAPTDPEVPRSGDSRSNRERFCDEKYENGSRKWSACLGG